MAKKKTTKKTTKESIDNSIKIDLVINKKDPSSISKSYLKINALIDQLSNMKEDIRKHIIEEAKKGIEFKEYGVNPIKQSRVDYKKSEKAWLEAGKELPTEHIPAHDQIDMAKFKSMLDWKENAEYKITSESWIVRTK